MRPISVTTQKTVIIVLTESDAQDLAAELDSSADQSMNDFAGQISEALDGPTEDCEVSK